MKVRKLIGVKHLVGIVELGKLIACLWEQWMLKVENDMQNMCTNPFSLCSVLSDAHSRAIYDIFGKKGLEVEGWEVCFQT